MTYDDTLRALWKKNHNVAIPWVLMASYLYYCRYTSILSDPVYDKLCVYVRDNFDKLEHRHKSLIDIEALNSGSLFYLKEEDYPTIIKSAALNIDLNLDKI